MVASSTKEQQRMSNNAEPQPIRIALDRWEDEGGTSRAETMPVMMSWHVEEPVNAQAPLTTGRSPALAAHDDASTDRLSIELKLAWEEAKKDADSLSLDFTQLATARKKESDAHARYIRAINKT